jgi:hypothetical protein
MIFPLPEVEVVTSKNYDAALAAATPNDITNTLFA